MCEKKVKVSVIIPTYNRPGLLGRAIKSVLSQTYGNFEIIVVDDASPTDGASRVVERFHSERIKYFRRSENGGVSSARNSGLQMANGKLVGWCGDDDEWLPNKLQCQVDVFKEVGPEVAVVHSNCFVVAKNRKYVYHRPELAHPELAHPLDKLLQYDFIADITTLVRRSVFDTIGFFDERIPYGEDWDFYIRAAKRFEFRYIREPLAIIHEHQKSGEEKRLGDNASKRARGYQIIVQKHWQEYEKRKKILARYLSLIGSILFDLGNSEDGTRYLVQALRTDPLQITPALVLLANTSFLRKVKRNINHSQIEKIATSLYYRDITLANRFPT